MTPRTLCIVGGAPSWTEVPKDTEIWCVSTVYQRLLSRFPSKVVGRVFQLHGPHLFEPWLASLGSSAVIIKPAADLPKATVLPSQELLDFFGANFTSSAAWMMGWAILCGHYDRIELYGFDMQMLLEYGQQRDQLFWFWGVACGKGIDVVAHPSSGIAMQKGTYGL